jgi:hypothetical protein
MMHQKYRIQISRFDDWILVHICTHVIKIFQAQHFVSSNFSNRILDHMYLIVQLTHLSLAIHLITCLEILLKSGFAEDCASYRQSTDIKNRDE